MGATDVVSALSTISAYSLKNKGFWMGKNFKFYDVSWGGNGSTGGKNKFAGKWSKYIGIGGNALGLYSSYQTYQQYQNGTLSTMGAAYLGTVDAAGFSGNVQAGFYGIGTSLGKNIVESDWYFNSFMKDYNW
jgi:hypothetical protein